MHINKFFFFIFLLYFTPSFAGGLDKQVLISKVEGMQRRIDSCIGMINRTQPSESPIYIDPILGKVPTFANPRKINWSILSKSFEELWSSLDAGVKDILSANEIKYGSSSVYCHRTFVLENLQPLGLVVRFGELVGRTIANEMQLKLYTERSWDDLRGYLFLKEKYDSRDPLLDLPLSRADMTTRKNLVGMCRNSKLKNCDLVFLNGAYNFSSVRSMYLHFEPVSRRLFESFFEIPKGEVLRGVTTTRTSDYFLLTVPFSIEEMGYLKSTFIESVTSIWRMDGLGIELMDYKDPTDSFLITMTSKSKMSWVSTENGVSGIFLDYNDAIPGSKNTSFVIAHEFGHILGFIDCYMEFFDVDENAFIYYSLDPENIMCSRDGKVLPIHLQELRRVYR